MGNGLSKEKIVAYDIMAYAMRNHSDKLGILDVLEIGVASVSSGRLKEAFGYIKSQIRHGGCFAESMKGKYRDVFHDYEIEAIEKGENVGEVDVAMRGLVERLSSN